MSYILSLIVFFAGLYLLRSIFVVLIALGHLCLPRDNRIHYHLQVDTPIAGRPGMRALTTHVHRDGNLPHDHSDSVRYYAATHEAAADMQAAYQRKCVGGQR